MPEPIDKSQTFISVDIETDGPVPGLYSMLSLGAAKFDTEGNLLDTFSVNLNRLAGARMDTDTMEWWSQFPDAYEAATKDPVPPMLGILRFTQWATGGNIKVKPTLICYPAGFDFTFIYYYMVLTFGTEGRDIFGFSCIDIKSQAAVILGTPFRETVKRTMPKEWFSPEHKHTHVAVEDAIGQGELYFRMHDWYEKAVGR